MRSQVGVLLAFGSADFMALGQAEQGALCARLGLHEEKDRAGRWARPGARRRWSRAGIGRAAGRSIARTAAPDSDYRGVGSGLPLGQGRDLRSWSRGGFRPETEKLA